MLMYGHTKSTAKYKITNITRDTTFIGTLICEHVQNRQTPYSMRLEQMKLGDNELANSVDPRKQR